MCFTVQLGKKERNTVKDGEREKQRGRETFKSLVGSVAGKLAA